MSSSMMSQIKSVLHKRADNPWHKALSSFHAGKAVLTVHILILRVVGYIYFDIDKLENCKKMFIFFFVFVTVNWVKEHGINSACLGG